MTSLTGGWFIADVGPHNYANIEKAYFTSGSSGIYNKVVSLWTISNLTTKSKIDFSKYSTICFNMSYYIPKQERTGQGIYFGILSEYNAAIVALYLDETTSETEVTKCMNTVNINGYPFIEIFDGHTAIPYAEWSANTYFTLKRVYLR